MSPLFRNLALALILALLVWLGYIIFFQEDEVLVSSSNSGVVNEAVRDGQEFLFRLQQVRSVKLNGALFEDPRFHSLLDIRQELVPETVGRENPFLPLEGVVEDEDEGVSDGVR